jgi:hypothetical protein
MQNSRLILIVKNDHEDAHIIFSAYSFFSVLLNSHKKQLGQNELRLSEEVYVLKFSFPFMLISAVSLCPEVVADLGTIIQGRTRRDKNYIGILFYFRN